MIYIGKRGDDGCSVIVSGERAMPYGLPPRYDLHNHSPMGFEWGYGGSGPAQLALALCCHALNDDERARHVYQEFKFRCVAWLDKDEWQLTREDVIAIVQRIEKRER